jgi:hypothetical protein
VSYSIHSVSKRPFRTITSFATAERFDLKPEYLAADTAYGSAEMLNWVVNEKFYGNPTGRETFMVVNLDTPAQIAELMYILTWFTGGEPTFTPPCARKYMARQSRTRRKS